MAELSGKAVNLTVLEMLVLLSLKKVPSIYGLFENGDVNYTQKDINEALFKMNKKGIISQNNNLVKISKSVEDILNEIIASKRILVINSKDDTIQELCIYLGAKNVLLRFDGNGSERMHLQVLDKEQTVEAIMESGWPIVSNVSSIIDGDGRVSDPDESIKKLFEEDMDKVISREDVYGVAFEVSSSEKKRLSQITLLNRGIDDFVVFDKLDDHKVFKYSDAILKYLLEGLWEE